MDPLKGEIALVRKDARVLKSMGAIKFTEKPETISEMEGPVLLVHKKEKTAFHGDMMVRKNDLARFDQKLRSSWSSMRRSIDRAFQ
ncbi:MAG: hypothetical protein A2156_10565 [Deltaproteobacteria bacterium RBG_16_48_10]|nr:MAG: hypothetical protein A2156_10565 [Deltaproteobacteria bacterium RBG_16_48_10]